MELRSGFFFVNADVERAFDPLYPRETDYALRQSNLPSCTAAAIMQEGIQVMGSLDYESVEADVPINACIRQGTVEASRLFSAIILSPFIT